MTSKRRPIIGRLLFGSIFLSVGVAAVVVGTTTVEWGPALGLALIVGGVVSLAGFLIGAARTDDTSSPELAPGLWPDMAPSVDPPSFDDEPDLLEQARMLDETY